MKRLITGAVGVAMASASLAFAGAPAIPALTNHPMIPAHNSGVRAGSGFNDISSYNWSGYAADPEASGDGSATFTSVIGKWQVPTATCEDTANESHVIWVGLDGFSDNTVEQGGTFAYCSGYTPTYYAWWEMYPTNDIHIVYNVNPGDFITASVTVASGKYKITVDDTTLKHNFSITQKCSKKVTCSKTSAEWIAEAPSFSGSTGNLAEWTNQVSQNQIGFYNGFATEEGGKQIAMGDTTGLWNIGMINQSDTYYLAVPGYPGTQGQGFQDYWYAEN